MADDDNSNDVNNDNDALSNFIFAVQFSSYLTLSTIPITNSHQQQLLDKKNWRTAKHPIQPSRRRADRDAATHAVYDFAKVKKDNNNTKNGGGDGGGGGSESSSNKRYLRVFDRRLDFQGVKNNPFGGVFVERYDININNNRDDDGDFLAESKIKAVSFYSNKKKVYLDINNRGDFIFSKEPVPFFVELFHDSDDTTEKAVDELLEVEDLVASKMVEEKEKIKSSCSSQHYNNNGDDSGEKDAYDTFLSAVESKSFIQLSTTITTTTTTTATNNIASSTIRTAKLPVQPVIRSQTKPKGHDSKPQILYALGKQPSSSHSSSSKEKDERFLRFFRWNDKMINFNGEYNHNLSGLVVQRYHYYDDDNNDIDDDKNNDIDSNNNNNKSGGEGEGEKVASSAITIFSEKMKVYLSINEKGMFVVSEEVVPLHVQLVEKTATVDMSVLSEEDKEHFKTQGYLILKNAVPQEYLQAARHNINWQIGAKGKVDTKLFPTNLRSKIINNSPVLWSALNILLGQGNVHPWEGDERFQIATRYPQNPYNGEYRPDVYRRQYGRPGKKGWHIDCAQCECPFTLLVGVALSDQLVEGSGCLYVYPGMHLSDAIREYKKDCLGKEKSYSDKSGNKPDIVNVGSGDGGGSGEGKEAVPVFLEKGDVVLAHAMLPHSASENVSGDIRYQLFYRVKHARLDEVTEYWMEDPNRCFMV